MNTGRIGYHLQSDFPIKLNSSILLTISIDQKTQTKQYFRSMVNTLIEEVDQACTLTLFLPWKLKVNYFAALGAPANVAEEAAKTLCKQWIADNKTSINLLKKAFGKRFSILFDHTIMNTAAFCEQVKISENLFNSNSEFRHSVSNLAKNYTKNKLPHPPHFFTSAFSLMKNYLIQQSNLVVLLSQMDFSYEIYPGKNRAHAMKIALRRFGKSDKMQFVSLLKDEQDTNMMQNLDNHPMMYNTHKLPSTLHNQL